MNATGPTETAIWVAVYAGECVWSRRASETSSLTGAYRAADNAVLGFRDGQEAANKKAAEAAAEVKADAKGQRK